jgi:indolepyruvate ferredoxin oxidoreductase beta subunit
MSYEDAIRVADLKTRAGRFERVRSEVRAGGEQLLVIEEFLHPRLEEIADTLPARWGRWLLASGAPRRWVERAFTRGRTVRTSALPGFLLLSAVAGLRRWRRGTLRFASEQPRIDEWLADIAAAAARDIVLAIEIARCQRVVKGYGDTHDRGLAKFAALRAAWRQAGAAAPRLAALRAEALADESGLAESAAAVSASDAHRGDAVPRRG